MAGTIFTALIQIGAAHSVSMESGLDGRNNWK